MTLTLSLAVTSIGISLSLVAAFSLFASDSDETTTVNVVEFFDLIDMGLFCIIFPIVFSYNHGENCLFLLSSILISK